MLLRNKIILSVVAIISIFGFLAVGTVFVYTKKTLIEKKQQELILLMNHQTFEISKIFENLTKSVQTISKQDFIREYLGGEREIQNKDVLEALRHYDMDGKYSAIYLMDLSGKTLVSTSEDFVEKNYAFRNYFKESVNGKISYYHALGITSGEMGYYAASPVFDQQSNIIGVIVVKAPRSIIDDNMRLANSIGGKIMLVDDSGVVIYSNDEERLYKTLGPISSEESAIIKNEKRYGNIEVTPLQYPVAQEAISDDNNVKIVKFFDDEDSEEELFAIKKIDTFPYHLIVEQGYAEYATAASTVSYILAAIIMLSILGSVIILSILIVIFLKPLKFLHEAAIKISNGDLSVRLDGNDFGGEFEKLAGAFNVMISNLKKTNDTINAKVKRQVAEIKEKSKKIENQQKITIGILKDVQEEKNKSEILAKDLEKFQLAVASASDHIVITDSDGVILYMNKAAESITGYSSKECLGKKAGAKELWGGLMDKNFYKKMWKTIKADKKVFSGEITNKRKNGEKYEAFGSISPIFGEDGSVKFFIGIERDITREKEIDRMKSEFVSVASHQLRTPLTGIKWFTELLLENKKLSAEQKDYISEIYNSNERMISLVSDLLNVSRIETGKNFEVEKKQNNLVTILNEVISEQILVAKGKGIEILSKNKPVSELIINVDAVKIKQVLQNLLSNAIKYSAENTKVFWGYKDEKKKFTFFVKDAGLGIPLEQQKRIFEKFFRANNVLMTGAEGTGLGLYIVKSIIEAHGGKVWFESAEGKGTTFFFEIPK